MFKALTLYRIADCGAFGTLLLEKQLGKEPFLPCAPTQPVSLGWAPPRGIEHGPLVKPAEQELMAELDTARHALADLIDRAREVVACHAADAHLRSERDDLGDADHLDRAEPSRWISIARTHLQEGLMALERAVTMPTHF